MSAQSARIQALLSAPVSPLRTEALRLGFDALVGQPASIVAGHPDLAVLIVEGLQRANVELIARRHVLPAILRVEKRLASSDETLRDFLSNDAETTLRALVASGKGPRFTWLKGAVDPGDVQKLIAPVIQQVLTSFVGKLPIPGLSGGARPDDAPPPRARGAGGFVGMLGKQVAKGASQLAGGLGLQQVVRDFSQSASTEVRTAFLDRVRSEEGREILRRIRDRVLDRVLDAKATTVVDDLLRVSPAEVVRIAEGAVSRTRELPLFRDVLTAEIRAVLAEIGARTLGELLDEMKLLEGVRGAALAAVEPGVVTLVKADAFGAWIDQVLSQSAE